MKAVKQHLKRPEMYAYNLAEIMLALVVIVIGVVGVMSLFPVSQDANQKAIGQTSSADAGDQFVRIIASKLKINWELSTALPVSKPEVDESTVNFTSTDAGNTLHSIEGVTLSYDDVDGDGSFDFDADGGDTDNSGIFLITQNTDTNISDFSAVVRVWRTAATYRYYDASTGAWAVKSVPSTSGIKLNVELSYPSELPYARRQKKHFTLNVFRPLEQPATGYIFAGNLTASNINQPPTVGLSGTININPNNSGPGGNPEFTMTLADGTEITRDDLHSGYAGYTGKAISVLVRPKGNGNQNGLYLNGVAVPLENKHGYHVSGNLNVVLYNGKKNGTAKNGNSGNGSTSTGTTTTGTTTTGTTTTGTTTTGSNGNGNSGGGGGTAMGQWYIDINASNAVLTEVF